MGANDTSNENIKAQEAKTRQEQERKKAEEEAARQARIAELEKQIEVLDIEVSKLQKEIKQYETMKGKIDEAICQLASAQSNIEAAKSQLATAYVSEAAKEGMNMMEDGIAQIGVNVSTLSGTIIPAANKKIEEKKKLLLEKQTKLNQLKEELLSL